ncbi:hypothetical protein D3C81_1735610 [compost metagenome]
MLNHVAFDLDHVLLLDLAGVGGELAQDLPVLGEHQQTAGIGLQVGAGGQALEVALERALAVAMLFAQGFGADGRHGAVRVHARGHVEQDGHRLRRGGLGVLVELDFLGADLELRLVDDFAVDGDPAALDEQLSLPTGTADEFDEAFGETNRVSHDRAVTKKGWALYLPGAG